MPISGKQAVAILQKQGFVVARQRGSHVVLTRQTEAGKSITVVLLHKELKRGTIRGIARLAGVSTELFGL